VQLGFWALNITVEVALLVNLYRNGLYRIYPALFLFLGLDLVESAVGMATFRSCRNAYAMAYFIGQGLRTVLGIAVVLELYRLALEARPALASFGRKTVVYVLAAAALIATFALFADTTAPDQRSAWVFRFFRFERTMNATLVVFLLLIGGFMAWFPVRLKRNVTLYIGGFVLYFLSRSFGLLLMNVLPLRDSNVVANAMLATGGACLLLWLFALREPGEMATMVVGHRWNPDAAGRLSSQLDAINRRLLRLARSSGR